VLLKSLRETSAHPHYLVVSGAQFDTARGVPSTSAISDDTLVHAPQTCDEGESTPATLSNRCD